MASQLNLNVKTTGSQGANLKKLLASIKVEEVRGYKVGWPESARYQKKGEGTTTPPTVAEVALWQEFGVPENNLPERPFFRNANRMFVRIVAGLIKKFAENGTIGKSGTKRLADVHVRLVQSSIDILKSPPLKSRVGNPLVDTGLLRRTVSHELIK